MSAVSQKRMWSEYRARAAHMGLGRRRRLATTVLALSTLLLVPFVTLSTTVAGATTATPETFTGATALGRYIVDLVVKSSTTISIDITTPDVSHSKCPYGDYQFDTSSLKNGAFSATGAFSSGSPQLTFTVRGTLLSAFTARGTVTGNYGCGADSFDITRPLVLSLSTSPVATAMDPGLQMIYAVGTGPAPNYQSYLYFIHATTNTVVRTVDVGSQANQLTVDTSTNAIYVSTSVAEVQGMDIVSGRAGKVTGFIKAVTGPGGFDPKTGLLYFGGGTVSVVNGRNNKVVASVNNVPSPTEVAVDPQTDNIYLTSQNDAGGVWVINGKTNELVGGNSVYPQTIPFSRSPVGLAADPATGRVYFACSGASSTPVALNAGLDVVPATTDAVTAADNFNASSQPVADGIGIDTQTNTIYVANASNVEGEAGWVLVINARTLAITRTIYGINASGGLEVDASNHIVYVAGPGAVTGTGSLYVIHVG
jgi:DNA-binding beta-propeller fold protein YncE